MRISEWISDVCSSDLGGSWDSPAVPDPAIPEKFLYCQVHYSACVAGAGGQCASPVQASLPFPRRSLSLPRRLAGPLPNKISNEGSPRMKNSLIAAALLAEIGRATCRERVWPYG